MLHLRKIAFFLAVVFCISLAGCSADAPQSKAAGSIDQMAVYRQNSASQQTQNLAKLCKVWGYAKYYHPAFLLGTSDWDAELLSLLSKVSACETSDDVNALLHEWFTSLGEIDYKARIPKAASGSDASVSEADLSWTADADYLGEALVGDLAKLPTMLPTNLDRTHAPVFFDSLGVPDFPTNLNTGRTTPTRTSGCWGCSGFGMRWTTMPLTCICSTAIGMPSFWKPFQRCWMAPTGKATKLPLRPLRENFRMHMSGGAVRWRAQSFRTALTPAATIFPFLFPMWVVSWS